MVESLQMAVRSLGCKVDPLAPLPACLALTAWTVIADRVRDTKDTDRWAYRITHQERAMLDAAIAAGRATTAQRRAPSGAFTLLARGVS